MGDTGDDDSVADMTFYNLLGIKPNASAKQIKKAYRKKALQLHPDKNQANPDEAKRQFQLVNEANEVLSNPACRRAYDLGGMTGVQMFRQTGSSIPPELMALGLSVGACILCLAGVLMLIFPIFLGMKADGEVDWTWARVWIPLWIIDAVLVIGTLLYVKYHLQDDEDEDRNPDDEPEKKGHLLVFCYVTKVWCMVIVQVLLVMKMDGAGYPWYVCVLPWIPAELCNCWILSQANKEMTNPMEKSLLQLQYRTSIGEFFAFYACIGLVCAKLEGAIDAPWAAVLAPLYASWPVLSLYQAHFYKKLGAEFEAMAEEAGNDQLRQAAEQMHTAGSGKIASLLGSSCCWVPFVIMLTTFLDNWSDGSPGDLTMTHTLIPVYLCASLFVLITIVLCLGACLFGPNEDDEDGMDEEHGDEELGEGRKDDSKDSQEDDEPSPDSKDLLLDNTPASDTEEQSSPPADEGAQDYDADEMD